METVRQVIHDDPVPPSRLVPRVARDLETICLKCLNKDPQKRYASAEELADDLDRYREGKPIKARPTPVWERGHKWSKRRPAAALALALGLAGVPRPDRRRHRLPALHLLQKERRNAWVLQQQDRGMELLDQADKASTPDELQKAQVELATFLQDAKAEPRLQPISLRIEAKQKWVGDRLRRACSSRAGGPGTRSRGPGTVPEVPGPAAGSPVVRGGLRGAGPDGPTREAPGLGPCRTGHLRPGSARRPTTPGPWRSRCRPRCRRPRRPGWRDDCYDLLLIRSQAAEARPRDCGSSTGRSGFARKTTAAYHLRRADCLEPRGRPRGPGPRESSSRA